VTKSCNEITERVAVKLEWPGFQCDKT